MEASSVYVICGICQSGGRGVVIMIFEILFLFALSGLCTQGNQHRIFEDIIESKPHVKHLRPVLDQKTTTVVSLDAVPVDIVHFDDIAGQITTTWWLNVTWRDELLGWSTNNYGQEGEIVVPTDTIWIPEITIYNRVRATETLSLLYNTLARVKNTGVVTVCSYIQVTTFCPLSATFYPFDLQLCPLVFVPEAFDRNELLLQNTTQTGKEMLSDMNFSNIQWDLNDVIATTDEYDPMKVDIRESQAAHGRLLQYQQQKSFIAFSLELKRKLSLLAVFWVLTVTVFYPLLSAIIFLLPCDSSSHRSLFGIVIILLQLVLFLSATCYMPQEDMNSSWIELHK